MTLVRWPTLLVPSAVTYGQARNFIEQTSAWTGRTRTARWGPSSRYSAEVSFPPLDEALSVQFRFLASELSRGNRFTRLVLVENSQYGDLENLIDDPFNLSQNWIVSDLVREPTFPNSTTLYWAPSSFHFLAFPSGPRGANANNAASVPIPLGNRLFLSMWGQTGSGTTGTASLRVDWRDASLALLSTSVLVMDPTNPPFTTPDVWHYASGIFTRPPGASFVSIYTLADITAGRMVFAHPRVSVFPEIVNVNGAGQTGTSLAVNNCQPSSVFLSPGHIVSINLGGEEFQTVTISNFAGADASGNASIILSEPLRKSPPNNAPVFVARPFAVMRADREAQRWAVEPHGLYSAGLSLVEAY